METTVVCRGYIGIVEKKMETTIVCWGYIGIMEKKVEATRMGLGIVWTSRSRACLESKSLTLTR